MNLLPLTEKRIVREQYYKRLAVVALVFFTILISTVLISISVSYIVSAYEIKILEREVKLFSTAKDAKGVMASINIIKDTNSKLEILSQSGAKSLGYDLSSIFYTIASSSRVRLTSFAYDQTEIKKDQIKEVGHRIILGGVAKDREGLREFIKTLQADKRFKSVDLPVSNLIESKDIKFFVTLMVVKK